MRVWAAAVLFLAACGQPAAESAASVRPVATSAAEPAPKPETMTGAPATTASGLPVDVEAQRDNAEMCEHFAGEEPYDADRLKEINDALADSCRPLKAALPTLAAKYADDPAVMAVLAAWQEIADAYGG